MLEKLKIIPHEETGSGGIVIRCINCNRPMAIDVKDLRARAFCACANPEASLKQIYNLYAAIDAAKVAATRLTSLGIEANTSGPFVFVRVGEAYQKLNAMSEGFDKEIEGLCQAK